MGLFGKLFEKKECSICGAEIGLLGNRKLKDGNMCTGCANKLSPWFQDRWQSTVDEILEQLDYREENQKKVEVFEATRILGQKTKVYLDEDKMQFIIADGKNFKENNPDVLDFSQVTGVDLDTRHTRSEEKRQTPGGDYVSYNPPRYTHSYDFDVIIHVNHPYFEEMRFQLNNHTVRIEDSGRRGLFSSNGPTDHPDYLEYAEMGHEIKQALTEARQMSRKAAAPKQAVTCPWCGATTMPDASGCCEYCGGSVNG